MSPAVGRVELFAITDDGKLTNWSIAGWNYTEQKLDSGAETFPDGVPGVVVSPSRTAAPARLDVFAVGRGGTFNGGALAHWRFDGSWSQAHVHDASLAAGGVGASLGTDGATDAFALRSGASNSLEHWPGGIAGVARDRWQNWAGNRRTDSPEGHCYPTCREDLVAIVSTAAGQGKRVRAVGSSWSFTDIAVTPGYVVETNRLNRVIPNVVVPNALLAPNATSPQPNHLVHVEAGIKLEELMTILDASAPRRSRWAGPQGRRSPA